MTENSISHYQITGKIGEGGMGEVYSATDTRLNRQVALKILPEAFSQDSQRMGRFSREAQLLASLNHPNIASIFGLEESGQKKVLVMELVDGEDLSELIGRGPIPLERALQIALELARALEFAHDKGIIHRDLKPANVKLNAQGHVKVLDFGLAKALEGDLTSNPDLSHSPTISLAATQAGMILGTAGYMSPEQAKGVAVDRRADIWAFGVVLLEMLTGQQTFSGQTMSETMAAVIKEEPNWALLPEGTPRIIRRLLERCLNKDPHQRLQSIGEARIALADFLAHPDSVEEWTAPAGTGALFTTKHAALLAVGAVLLAGLATLAGWFLKPEPPKGPDLNVSVQSGSEGALFATLGPAVRLSPDGSRLAYTLEDGLDRSMYLRQLRQLDGVQIAGTEGAYHQFFSPDGQWVAFFTRSELKKVSVSGGTPLKLCEVNLNRGGDWSADGTIYLSPTPEGPLFKVSSAGGKPEELTTLQENEISHRWPQALPDGRGVIFTSLDSSNRSFDEATIEVLDLSSGERKVLAKGGTFGRYLPNEHLVYFQRGTMFAVPFDLDNLEVIGSPVPVLEGVLMDSGEGGVQFDFSQPGLLAYLQGTADLPKFSMLWVDRSGQTSPISDELKTFAEPRISPDGSRLAVQIATGLSSDIWIYDLRRGVPTRLTFEESEDVVPVWSPDGLSIAFASDRNGTQNIYRKLADGTGDIQTITESKQVQYVSSWSPDGKYLLYTQYNNETSADLMVVGAEGGSEPEVFLATPFQEVEGAFSPDGRWIAYQSNESGAIEVYVRPFPIRGGKWQISVDGGSHPRWSSDGKELFYRNDGGIMAAQVEATGDSFQVETPRRLFEGSFANIAFGGSIYADYDVAPDGRFVMFRGEGDDAGIGHVVLVTNWFDRLNSLMSGVAR